jgi:hypothetical protein
MDFTNPVLNADWPDPGVGLSSVGLLDRSTLRSARCRSVSSAGKR